MSQRKESSPEPAEAALRYYYLLFGELSALGVTGSSLDISTEELEEINRTSEMVADISDDPPRFMTST